MRLLRFAIATGCLLLVTVTSPDAPLAVAASATTVFERVAPSVVVVYTYDDSGKPAAQGSGVVVARGVVATNCHVLKAGNRYAVKHRNRLYQASLQHRDTSRDVCSLIFSDRSISPVPLGDTSQLKVGQKVYAVGAPRGLELTISDGIVAGLRPAPNKSGNYIQFTAPISKGSSGGGLFDEKGRLLGLTTFYVIGGQQLNFAVPVEWIRQLPRRTTEEQTRPNHEWSLLQWSSRAKRLAEARKWDELRVHSKAWTKAAPDEPIAWTVFGLTSLYLREYKDAITALVQATRLNPGNPHTLILLSKAYARSGEYSNALKTIRRALEIAPENAEAWTILGGLHSLLGNPKEAVAAITRSLEISPNNPRALATLANIYLQLGRRTDAVSVLERALDIDANNAETLALAGSVYYALSEPQKAINALERSLEINADNADSWALLGAIYYGLSKPEKSIYALENAVEIDPRHTHAWYLLAHAYFTSGRKDDAFVALKRVVKLDPKHSDALFLLGAVYKDRGDNRKVREIYARLKTVDPKRAKDFFRMFIAP